MFQYIKNIIALPKVVASQAGIIADLTQQVRNLKADNKQKCETFTKAVETMSVNLVALQTEHNELREIFRRMEKPEIDYITLAEMIELDATELAEALAPELSYSEIAYYISNADIAEHIEPYEIAEYIEVRDIAEAIDISDELSYTELANSIDLELLTKAIIAKVFNLGEVFNERYEH